jgi:diacylglycerol kinase (ATP)
MPAAMTVVVAINPTASFGKNRVVGEAVVESLRTAGHTALALVEPDYPALAAAARAAVTGGVDALVVVGGDGMVHLGANVVAGTDVPLGIVPAGSGNDFARGLGIPHDDIPAATRALLAALIQPPRVIDAGRLRWTDTAGEERGTWFAGALSAGFDAKVNERANAMRRPRGASRYLWAILVELVRMRPASYRLEIDGERVQTEGLLVAVANNTSLGGGLRLTPTAQLDDGELDVMIVSPVSRLRFLRLFPLAARGEHLDLPQVSSRRARRVVVDADQPIVAYADGERIAALPVEIEIVPGALRVLAPR